MAAERHREISLRYVVLAAIVMLAATNSAAQTQSLTPVSSRPTPATYELKCSPPRNVEEAGACADHASADAARRANWINIVGGILLLTSLGASAAALILSARATRAAERQAAHAEKATEVSLRAYLGIEKVDLVWSRDGKVAFDVWVKNSGQTPARYFEIAGVAGVTGLGAKLGATPIEGPFIRWLPIGRDQTRSARLHPENGSDINEDDVLGTTKVIYISGQLRYEDIFGEVWTEDFRAFRWSPSGVRQKMSFAAIKNEAPGVDLLDQQSEDT